MIVFNFGQAKTGSTFVYQILVNLRFISKSNIKQMYYPVLTPEVFAEIDRMDEPDQLFVVKCHAGMHERVRQLLDEERASVVATFRDPRDSALSQLDAGRRDTALGKKTVFVNFKTGRDIAPIVKRQVRMVKTVLEVDHPRIFKIPYFVLAEDQNYVVQRVCDFVGLSGHSEEVLQIWRNADREKKIGQYNKGVANRFATDLRLDDLRTIHEEVKDEADYVDQKTRSLVAGTRFERLFEQACRQRDAVIMERLGQAR
ncbi:MAG: sulfotransferase domain-containing protein [Kiloniellales bacterium]